MSSPSDGRTFLKRFAAALGRRLYPNTSLQRKVLAAAIGVSVDTIDNWLAALNEPKGHLLIALMDFFDDGFSREISDGKVTKLPNQAALEAARKRDEAEREYRKAMGMQ